MEEKEAESAGIADNGMDIQPYHKEHLLQSFYFPVSDGHQLYVEVLGNENGIPVVFFHGGPGGEIGDKAWRFFDLERFKVVFFDQRGTGKSKPFLSLENNTPFATIEDAEKLRKHFGLKKWIVFGGSYGSTLGLLYGILHPESILEMILRGIFLGRKEDIDWLFVNGAGNFYPHDFKIFRGLLGSVDDRHLVESYYKVMTGDDKNRARLACKTWADWENGILRIENDPVSPEIQNGDLSGSLLEAHYFVHKMFWNEDNYLLARANLLREIHITVFHGRFDIDCRVKGAYDLKDACPKVNLHIIQRGSHYPYDSPLFEALKSKMDELAEKYQTLIGVQ